MTQRRQPNGSWTGALAGAALVGGFWGIGEAAGVYLGGHLWLPQPLLLFATGALAGALMASVPGALFARILRGGGFAPGAWCGFVTMAACELCLAVAADPPPYQAAPWWSGNPLALLGGLGGLLVLAWLGARAPSAMVVLPLALALQGAARQLGRAEPTPTASAKPNVLVVTLDTVRADHLAPYGYTKIKTPNLDKLAADGAMFENAFASIGATGPSHTTLFTGQGTWSHGVLLNGVPAPGDVPTLAERLREAGYRTGAFVSAYVLESKIGLNRGFSVYDDDLSGARGTAALLPLRLYAAAYRHFYPDAILERRGQETVDLALEWLDEGPSGSPWFLWVHLFDAHGPYAPPPPYDTMYAKGDGRDPAIHTMDQVSGIAWYLERSLAGVTDLDWVIAQYDGEISYVDAQLGRVLDAVEASGQADNTVVVVLSDHGESLGEHGVWFNHGDDLYDPTLHIPLFLRFPGRIPAGARVPGVVEMVDVVPTVLELVGEPGDSALDGRSRVGAWEQPGLSGVARSMAFDRAANVRGRESGQIQRPTWRMVGLRGPSSLYVFREAADEELYEAAPGEAAYTPMPETSSIGVFGASADGAATLEALERQAQLLLNAGAHGVERSGVELSEEDREKLKALGYLE